MKRPRLALPLAVAIALGTLGPVASPAQTAPAPLSGPKPAPRGDAVAHLLQRLAVGEVALTTGPDRDILRAVLRELKVPLESQLAVFSRTSMQAGLIRPDNPRVLYFSDSTYVGWVPGGLIEAIAIDPERGPVFYALDPQDVRERRRTFVRESSCQRCHGGGAMERNPVLFARSLFATATGDPLRAHGSELITEQTPFERRWGGWYVTGYEGETGHRGNAFARERDGQLEFSVSASRPADLTGFVPRALLPVATSDVVALLVFEHQLAMQNSLLRAAQTVRQILETQPAPDRPTSADARFAPAVEDVLDHLLFREAASLPDGITGSDSFKRAFATGAPRSPAGHTLKDFSLRGRLFAHRCSFLIHSESFHALPSALRQAILARLQTVLHDDDPHGRYAYLARDERRRIQEILTSTLPDFPPPAPPSADR